MTTGQSANQKPGSKPGFYLALLAVIFIGPIIVAWAMHSAQSFVPESISNGHLIQSPLQLQNLTLNNSQGQQITLKDFDHDWVMLYINPNNACDKSCEDMLYKMRQVHKSLGKNSMRIKRVVMTLWSQAQPQINKPQVENPQVEKADKLDQLIQNKYQGTMHVKVNNLELMKFLQPLPSHKLALKQGYLYLMDPLGNVMMSYPLSEKPRGIYSDLKRLLKASRIG